MAETTTDMTMGVYRRLYSAIIHGRRINSVSDSAELLFLRLLVLADDFGNLQGDPVLIKSNGFPRRSWSVRKIEAALSELVNSGDENQRALVTKYTANGETYLHITNFENTQPSGKNGKRIQRWPVNPGESRCDQNTSKEHKNTQADTKNRIQVNPEKSRLIQCSEVETETEKKPKPRPLSKPTPDVSDDDLPSSPIPLSGTESRIRRWIGDRLSANDRNAIARAERLAGESPPVEIHGKRVPFADLFTRAVEEAIASDAKFHGGSKFMGLVDTIAARCTRDGVWPGEGLERTNGHTREPTTDELLAKDRARRAKL